MVGGFFFFSILLEVEKKERENLDYLEFVFQKSHGRCTNSPRKKSIWL